jgi:hypothetical protein
VILKTPLFQKQKPRRYAGALFWLEYEIFSYLDSHGNTVDVPESDGTDQGNANIKGENLAVYDPPNS